MKPEETQTTAATADEPQKPGFDRRSPQSPECLGDHGHDGRLDPAKNAGHGRDRPETHIEPRQGQYDEHGRQNETGPGHEQPTPARPAIADVDRQLRGVRSGDQIGAATRSRKSCRVSQPAADDLVFHQGDVRRRPAEAERADLEKKHRQVAQPRRRAWIGRCRIRSCGVTLLHHCTRCRTTSRSKARRFTGRSRGRTFRPGSRSRNAPRRQMQGERAVRPAA